MRFAPVILTAALVVAASPLVAQDAPARPDSLALARKYVSWLYDTQVDSLWAHTSADLRENLGSPDWWRQRTDEIVLRAGSETEVIEERFRMRKGRPQYWRTARFTDLDQPLLIRFVIDDAGLIAGVGFGPASQAPPTDD